MSKILELAREAGLVIDENNSGYDDLERFYTLARADLEAEIAGWKADQKENLANQCELQAVINKLEAENAKLREINRLLDSALIKAYPNGCYHGDVFELWNAARAALGENE